MKRLLRRLADTLEEFLNSCEHSESEMGTDSNNVRYCTACRRQGRA